VVGSCEYGDEPSSSGATEVVRVVEEYSIQFLIGLNSTHT
jgi:hypothetical protein